MDEDDIFGIDLDDSFELDDNGDFKLVSGVDNASQAIRNRLLTKFDEIAELGYHKYGNRAHDYLSETNIDLSRAHVEIYSELCLALDPRVFSILSLETSYNEGVIFVDVVVQLVNRTIVDLDTFGLNVFNKETVRSVG